MNKTVKIAICCILAVVMLVTGIEIVKILIEYNKASSAYENTADMAISETEPSGTDITAPVSVDFDMLEESYDDIIGWIYCEGTRINYPVVQCDDNSYYVRRMPDGTYNTAGSIFMDFRCASDFGDNNTIIYGHNMKNGTMFATLKKYSSQSFYEEHPVIWILTPEENYMVELVAGYVTSSGSDSFDLFPDENAMREYLDYSVGKSTFKSAVELDSVEKVVTFATCSYEYDTARYVLVGSLVPVGRNAVSDSDKSAE